MDQRQDGLIPEEWPPVDSIEPVRVWRVPWPLAPAAAILAPLFPKRLGPHLAASGWFAAYAAHLFSIVLCVGLFGAMEFEHSSSNPSAPSGLSLSEHLRRPFAATTLMLVDVAGSPPVWIGIAVGAVGVQAIVWAGAILFMPLFAAGERPGRLYFRSVKLILWSTSAIIAVGVAFTYSIGLIFHLRGELLPWELQDPATFDLLSLSFLFWFSVALRLGLRYGGPKDGPRWQSGPLRCEGCGYELTGLPADARCPECSRPVSDSMPDRREPPPIANKKTWKAAPRAFFNTLVQSWSARRFAAKLSVLRAESAARRFAAVNCALMAVVAAILLLPTLTLGGEKTVVFFLMTKIPPHEMFTPAACIVVAALNAECAILGFIVWLLIVSAVASRFGWRDARQRMIVVCYATGWLYVPLLLAAGALYLNRLIFIEEWGPLFQVPIRGWIEPKLVIASLTHAPAILALIYSFYRVRIMLVETRYANG